MGAALWSIWTEILRGSHYQEHHLGKAVNHSVTIRMGDEKRSKRKGEQYLPGVDQLLMVIPGLLCWPQHQNHDLAATNSWHDRCPRTVAIWSRPSYAPMGTTVFASSNDYLVILSNFQCYRLIPWLLVMTLLVLFRTVGRSVKTLPHPECILLIMLTGQHNGRILELRGMLAAGKPINFF